jgi:hypothetical protein
MPLRKGEPWGEQVTGPPDLEVAGSDSDLAEALSRAGATPLVRFLPSPGSDLARAVGLGESPPSHVHGSSPGGSSLCGRGPQPQPPADASVGHLALPMDALRLESGGLAVNAVVVGTGPDRLRLWHRRRQVEVGVDGRPVFAGRATTVVVMNGQYLRGADLAPRGHPGDGSCEIQVYAPAPGKRRLMRSRLGSGSHLPHPAITTARGHAVTVRLGAAAPVEVDGRSAGEAKTLDIQMVAGAYRLLV